MTCEWCMETNQPWFHRAFWLQGKFIDGCTSHKAESIAYHENSAAHKLASQCHKAKQNPEKTPAYLARQQLLKQFNRKLRLLFRNAHAFAKHKKSISDYNWLCDLDEAKGLTLCSSDGLVLLLPQQSKTAPKSEAILFEPKGVLSHANPCWWHKMGGAHGAGHWEFCYRISCNSCSAWNLHHTEGKKTLFLNINTVIYNKQ